MVTAPSQQRSRFRGVNRQILLSIALLLAAAALFQASVHTWMSRQSLATQMRSRSHTLGQGLALNYRLLDNLELHPQALQRLVQGYAALPDVLEIALVDQRGVTLAHNNPLQVGRPYGYDRWPELTAAALDALRHGGPKTLELPGSDDQSDDQGNPPVSIQITPLLHADGTIRGLAIVAMNSLQLEQQAQQTHLVVGLLLIGGIAATSAFIWLLLRWLVIRPLRRLSQAARQSSRSGDFQPPAHMPGNEIGQLAHILEDVFQQIRRSRESERRLLQDLQVSRGQLENLVEGKSRQLRESEGRFQRLADAVPVLIWLSNTDRRLTYFNQRWVEFTGAPVAQMLDEGWRNWVHPEDREAVLAAYRAAFDACHNFSLEFRLRRHDGLYRWMLVTGTPHYSRENTFAGFVGTCLDVTQRKHGEQLLQESEQRYRSIVETTNEWIWAMDEQANITYSNQAIECLVGYEPEEVTGKRLFQFLHPDDQPVVRWMIEKFRADKTGWTGLVFRWRHKDGSYRFLESNSVPTFDAQGRVCGFRGADRDVTEREVGEQRLANLQQRQELILNSAGDGILALDQSNQVVFLNSAGQRLLGWSQQNLMDRKDWVNCIFDNLLNIKDDLLGPDGTAAAQQKIEAVFRTKNRQELPVEYVLTPIVEAGQITGRVIIFKDISERKEIEKIKDDLLSTVSHELRTPLTSLRGFTELLLSFEHSPADARKYLTIIQKETLRLNRLINDFLDIRRIESGRQVYRFEAVELAAHLRESGILFEAQDPSHELIIQVPDELPPVWVDQDCLRQVLDNLLSNAIKFSPEGGRVTVSAWRQEDEVVVSVADQGVGVPEEAKVKLFTKFFRADHGRNFSVAGTGLGLAFVKEALEAQNGRVWFESLQGKGSTFFFSLPLAQASAAAV